MSARAALEAAGIRLRPRQRRPIGIGRVGRRQHRGLRLFFRAQGALAQGAQPLQSTGMGELRAAQAGDEVPAPHAPRLLEGAEHRIERGEAARNAFGENGGPGEDAVAGEELLGLRLRTLRGSGRAGGRGRHEQAPAPARARRSVTAGTERREPPSRAAAAGRPANEGP